MDLRLNDDNGYVQFLCAGDSLADAECRQPVWYVHAILTQKLFGLVLMNIHLVILPLIFVSRTYL